MEGDYSIFRYTSVYFEVGDKRGILRLSTTIWGPTFSMGLIGNVRTRELRKTQDNALQMSEAVIKYSTKELRKGVS